MTIAQIILVTFIYWKRIIYMLRSSYINIFNLDDNFTDLRGKVDDLISSNSNKGFKSNNKIYRRIFNKSSKESKSVDQFGDPYFYKSMDDETRSISITLPKSLIDEVNKYCEKKNITRSRLLRKIIEYSLNLKKED
jgi:hypothetical protein